MHKTFAALPLVALFMPAAVMAGTEPLYEATPGWVQQAEMGEVVRSTGPSELLYDWQYRIEDGTVFAYTDHAVRIDNPQALMEQNTQTITWMPDKGDLVINAFEIHRGGEVIDLLAQGVTFDVLRRELSMEAGYLEGELSATVSVPGLRQGDVLRLAHTVSSDEQALGDDVQVFQFLPSQPWQVGEARAIVSWPEGEEMYWAAEERVGLADPVLRDGYRYLSVDLPLAQPAPVPQDAPPRFRRPAMLRVGSFASWEEVSRVMAPHFESAAHLEAGSPIVEQARAIMARSDDPLTRAALATQLVQDEISYLFNGLDGGNYLPQGVEHTWAIRTGDCKAKSVLLLSLLREMGIQSEVVLVNTQGGDATPELLPMPAFDHMIVHAVIDGNDYWLDGTSAATRLANIGDVPPFYYALPLREGGSALVEMVQRDLALPQMALDMRVDHSAGVDFPALVTMTIDFAGPTGAQLRALVDAADPAQLRQMAAQFSEDGELQVSDLSLSYDEGRAIGTMVLQGIAQPSFRWEDGRLRSTFDERPEIAFNPDRGRAAWREIPVSTRGPMRMTTAMTMTLPQDGNGFSLNGNPDFDFSFANARVTGQTVLRDDIVRSSSDMQQRLGEIAAADLPEARRAAQQVQNYALDLVAPDAITWRWDLPAADRRLRAAPILAAYESAMEFAESDDFLPQMYRAQFLASIFDFRAAKADFDILVDEVPSTWVYNERAWLNEVLGDDAAAIADRRAAYELEPSNEQARALAQKLAYHGDTEEALALLDSLAVPDGDRVAQATTLATATALAGDLDGAHALLLHAVADAPQDPEALNEDCWFRGLFSVALESALARCTQAVERAADPANAIDSRALVHFRLGDFAAAIGDLDAAIDLAPEQSGSRYLRGIVRLAAGDQDGQRDLDTALLMAPQLEQFYTRHGIVAR